MTAHLIVRRPSPPNGARPRLGTTLGPTVHFTYTPAAAGLTAAAQLLHMLPDPHPARQPVYLDATCALDTLGDLEAGRCADELARYLGRASLCASVLLYAAHPDDIARWGRLLTSRGLVVATCRT